MRSEFASVREVASRIAAEHSGTVAGADAVLVPRALWSDFEPIRWCAREAIAVDIAITEDGVEVSVPSVPHRVVFVDSGVVTGRTAAAVAAAARASGAKQVELLVGVLPRDSSHALSRSFDTMAGLFTPLGHRDLRWHIGGLTPGS